MWQLILGGIIVGICFGIFVVFLIKWIKTKIQIKRAIKELNTMEENNGRKREQEPRGREQIAKETDRKTEHTLQDKETSGGQGGDELSVDSNIIRD